MHTGGQQHAFVTWPWGLLFIPRRENQGYCWACSYIVDPAIQMRIYPCSFTLARQCMACCQSHLGTRMHEDASLDPLRNRSPFYCTET